MKSRSKWVGGANPIAVDGAFSIYSHDLINYRRDQQHIKEQREAQRFTRTHGLYEALRAAKPFTTVSLLLGFSLFASIHTVYA